MKKRVLSFVLCLAMVVLLLPCAVMIASAEEEGIFLYIVKDGEATITYCDTSARGAIVIPETLGGYPVTAIGDNAFEDCYRFTSITIPEGVTSIGEYAFAYCEGLTSVTIPEGVASIGKGAFHYCSSLESIEIPKSVTSIGDNAFHSCESLVSVTIPKGVTRIGKGMFSWCESLESAVLPEGVTDIEEDAFVRCSRLSSVNIPESVINIAHYAFYGCRSLESITIPESVTYIGDYAFGECDKLTISCYAESRAETYAKNNAILYELIPPEIASGECGDNLTWKLDDTGRLTISGSGAMTNWESVSSVPWYSYRRDIQTVVIKNGATSIGDLAFAECYSLTSMAIPESVTRIGDGVFGYCNSLTNINVDDENPNYCDIDGNLFSKDKTLLIKYASGKTDTDTAYTIPSGTTSIGNEAFRYCEDLTSVTIPNSVTSIGDWAFAECYSLTSIAIPGSVASIGVNAFYYCSWLKSIEIREGVKIIGDRAFSNCYSLESIEIPESVTSIGDGVFSSCWGLLSVTIPDSITSIADNAFNACSSLSSVTIPDSVTRIGKDAFEGCKSLTSIDIPKSVASIGNDAFLGCKSLKGIYVDDENLNYCDIDGNLFNKDKTQLIKYATAKTDLSYSIPESVTHIGDNAFCNGFSLESIVIPEGVTSIGDGAFNGCVSLESIAIPNGVTSIGKLTFNNCESLESIVIPNGVMSIGQVAFSGCESLISIEIPESVTSIGEMAFYCCYNLGSITIPESVTYIGDYAFGECNKLTISCYEGSFAESYAKNNNIPLEVIVGETVIASGECGDNLTWKLNDEGLLTISGTGAMHNFSGGSPWYANRNGIKSVAIESGVTSIGNWAFYQCTNLTSVAIPDSVTTIGDGAFRYCSGITSLTIGENVASIGEGAFHSCRLVSIDVADENKNYCDADGVLFNKDKTEIIQYAIGKTDTTVTIPDSVTTIGTGAFSQCKSLTSITIPEGVTSIGKEAFHNCNRLAYVTIPDSVTSIGKSAFYGCKLMSIDVAGENKNYCDVDGVLFNKDKTELIQYTAGKTNTFYAIPEGVKRIGYGAFPFCQSLTSVTIPDSVTSIGNSAFFRSKGLTSITIPSSVMLIEDGAFYDCTNLESVIVLSSEMNIGSSVFTGCNKLIIKGYAGSSAETYAAKNSIPFKVIEPESVGGTYFEIKDVTVRPGEVAAVPVFVSLENMYSMEYKFSYNSALSINQKPVQKGFEDFDMTPGSVITKNPYKVIFDTMHPLTVSGDAFEMYFNAPAELGRYTVNVNCFAYNDDDEVEQNVSFDIIVKPTVTAGELTVGNATAKPGDTVEIPVSLAENPGVGYMEAVLKCADYLPEGVSVDDVRVGEAFESMAFSWSHMDNGDVLLKWESDADCKNDGVIATLVLSVTDQAPEGAYDLPVEVVKMENKDAYIELDMFCGGYIEITKYQPGDINGDGKLNTRDVTTLRRYIAGGYEDIITVVESLADVNGDGRENARDVVALRKLIAG